MIWLLDGGHGGLINGIYQTSGKRSPIWDNESQLFEGEFNRSIVNRLVEMLTAENIRYVSLCPEMEDIPLSERVDRANAVNGDCVLLSIHANAGGGRGFEAFTSPGETKSDALARVFYEEMALEFPGDRMRKDLSDGDPDKESPFYILTKTRMPAVLTESFFMDNERECREYLMTKEGRDRIAEAHFNAIMRIESGDY